MNKRLLIFSAAVIFLSSAAYSFENFLDYKIQYSSVNSNHLEVILNSNFDQNGDYTILFPLGSISYTISTENKDIHLIETEDPYVKKIKGVPGEKLTVKYSYYLPNPNRSIIWPIIEPHYFTFKIDKVFATPEHSQANWKINLDTSALPENFSVYSSHSENKRQLFVETSIAKFKNWMLVAGDLNIQKIQINKKTINLVLLNKIKSLNGHPAVYLEALIKAQREFWKDNDFENYLIVLHEGEPDVSVPGPAGLHYDNAIILQVKDRGPELAYLNIYSLSHELFHAWIGYKIALGLPQGALQWFLEGINDYYGLIIPYRNGLITRHEYIEGLNQLLLSYFLLPINYISNDAIANNFYNDRYYNYLAQLRGHLFAKIISSKHDNKKFDLLSVILYEIYRNFIQSHNQHIQQKDVDKVFLKYLKKQDRKLYIDLIYNGDLLKLEKSNFNDLKLINKSIEVPEIGFNGLDLIQKRIISQIDPESPAYVAGLRNGQKVRSHTISFANTNRSMSVWVEENNQFREITFFPKKKTVIVPQFHA